MREPIYAILDRYEVAISERDDALKDAAEFSLINEEIMEENTAMEIEIEGLNAEVKQLRNQRAQLLLERTQGK